MAWGVTVTAKPSRTTIGTVAAGLVLLGGLLAVGRLSPPRSGSPSGPAASTTRPAVAAVTSPSSLPWPILARVGFGEPVDDVAVSPEGVWVTHGGALARVDPATNRVSATVPAEPDAMVGVAIGAGAVWASAGHGLVRVDPVSARVVARITIGTLAGTPVAADPVGVWAVCCPGDPAQGGGRLLRVDPASDRVVAAVRLPGPADAVGVGPSGVWARSPGGPVWRVDPATNRVTATVRVPGGLGATRGSVLVTRAAVWVSDPAGATVYRIDPGGPRLAGERLQAEGRGLAAAADGTVWASSGGGLVGLGRGPVKGVTLEEVGSSEFNALAAGWGAVWVAAPTGLFRVDLGALH
jgi:hypothetical protein